MPLNARWTLMRYFWLPENKNPPHWQRKHSANSFIDIIVDPITSSTTMPLNAFTHPFINWERIQSGVTQIENKLEYIRFLYNIIKGHQNSYKYLQQFSQDDFLLFIDKQVLPNCPGDKKCQIYINKVLPEKVINEKL